MTGRAAPAPVPRTASDASAVDRAVAALLRGGLVALPTETVYGLAADAQAPAAVRAIFAAKGRPADHPLIIHVRDAAAAAAWADHIPAAAHALMDAFWPGPLTLILPRSPRATDLVTGGQPSVGLRCPAGPWAQAVLRAFGAARGDSAAALAAPSANRYGRISPTCADHVRADLGEKPAGLVDVILDGGPSVVGIESTIVDCTGSRPRLLRPGAIDRAAIGAVAGSALALPDDDREGPRAPGRVLGHYAPRTSLEVVVPANLARRRRALGPAPVAILAPAPCLAALRSEVAPGDRHVVAASMPTDYAQALYAQLRTLDSAGCQRILVAAPPTGLAWEAIYDRLWRAAAGSGTR